MLIALVYTGMADAQSQFSTLPPAPAAEAPRWLLGAWGSEAQCRAHQAGEESNPARLPFVIDPQWIRQGFIYCYLTWRGHDAEKNRAWADARCGEDDLREYSLVLNLRGQALDIRWSDSFTARNLRFCGA